MLDIEQIGDKLSRAINERDYVRRLNKIASNSNPELRKFAKLQLVENNFLSEMANDEDWAMRYFVAKLYFTPSYMLAELGRDESLAVSLAIAANAKTPEYALELLENSKSPAIKYTLMLNYESTYDGMDDSDERIRLPKWLSEEFHSFNELKDIVIEMQNGGIDSDDVNEQRYINGVAGNHIYALTMLEESGDEYVQQWASEVKKSVLEAKYEGPAFDEDGFVGDLAHAETELEYHNVLKKMKTHKDSGVKRLYDVKNAELRFLERFATSEDWNMRYFVAHFPNTPAHILTKLSHDSKLEVLLAVASNPRTPDHALKHLAKNDELGVVYATLLNPNVPDKIINEKAEGNVNLPFLLTLFIRDFGKFNVFHELMNAPEFADNKTPMSDLVAKCYDSLLDTLKRLQNYGDPDVREWAKIHKHMMKLVRRVDEE
jgi:hypothetical protein